MNISFNTHLISAIRFLIIILTAFLPSQLQIVFSQEHLLDPNFGVHGKQLTTGGKGYNKVIYIHKLKNNKILFGAIAHFGKFSHITITRLEVNGKIDSSYGTNGLLKSDIYYGESIVMDSSENIYLGGFIPFVRNVFRVEKYNKHGSLDISFGNQGLLDLISVEKNNNNPVAHLQLNNEYLYVLSNLNNKKSYPFDLQKFDLYGNKDSSFGQNGSLEFTGTGNVELEFTGDDKFLVAEGMDDKMTIIKFLDNGNKDTSFGQNGIAVYNDTTFRFSIENIEAQNVQSIFITGTLQIPSGFRFISKFSNNGMLDTSFANKGFLNVATSPYPEELFTLIDDTHLTVVYGERSNNKYYTIIKQFNLDGSVNTSFANSGSLTFEIQESSIYSDYGDVSLDRYGNILIGYSYYTRENPYSLQISVLDSIGSYNSSFGTNGKLDLYFGFDVIFSSELFSLNDNSIIQSGSQYYGGWWKNIQLNKFTKNGIPDTRWAVDGVFTPPRLRLDLFNNCGTTQADGKILIAGYASVDHVSEHFTEMCVSRTLPQGALDSTFGEKGISYLHEPGYGYSYVNAISVEKDGNILLGGYSDTYRSLIRLDERGTLITVFENNNIDFRSVTKKILVTNDEKIYKIGSSYNYIEKLYSSYIIKYFHDGKTDTLFGNKGSIILTKPGHSIIMQSAVLDQLERIILVGLDTIQGSDSSMIACRFLPNGMLDTNFGDQGYFRYKVDNTNSTCTTVLVDKQGRIYIGGTAYKTNTRDFILLCLDQDGKLINSFGDNGLVHADFYGGKDALTSMIFDSDENIILGGNSESSEAYYMALAKVLNNLNVGTIDDATTTQMQYIYPNPISNQATLKFTLTKAANVSINISDLSGNTMSTPLRQQHFNAGEHHIELKMSNVLMPGYYFISILTENQKRNIKFFKI